MKSRQQYLDIRVRKYYAVKYSESIYIQIKPQHWRFECQQSMEGISLDYFKNDKTVRKVNSEYEFYS